MSNPRVEAMLREEREDRIILRLGGIEYVLEVPVAMAIAEELITEARVMVEVRGLLRHRDHSPAVRQPDPEKAKGPAT